MKRTAVLETGGAEKPSQGEETASYLPRLTRERLLSAEEEVRLTLRARAGDNCAKDQLIEANMRLVLSIAKSYHSTLIPYEDLVQEGAIGLITAAERFDPARGFRFSTYATHWIRQSIGRAIDNKSRAIRVPAHISETLRKIERTRAEILKESGEEPTAEEIARKAGLTLRKVDSCLTASLDPVSLDAMVGEDENTSLVSMLGDKTAADPEDEVVRREVEIQIQKMLNALSERERQIMRRRLGFDDAEARVLQDIGAELNLSRERVRQIEAQALRKMRRQGMRMREYLLD
jgi:RNA polymerase primary sigma factor